MRFQVRAVVVAAILVGVVTGCSPGAARVATGQDTELRELLPTDAEVAALGGWEVTPDEGSVDGATADCTGAPFDWPDLATVSAASEFLDRPGDSIAVVLKRVDGDAAANVEALREALRPCTPAGGELPHGAMIEPVGDDSFAYQSHGEDDLGSFMFFNVLIACGDLHFETLAYSYSGDLDQALLESLLGAAMQRLVAVAGC